MCVCVGLQLLAESSAEACHCSLPIALTGAERGLHGPGRCHGRHPQVPRPRACASAGLERRHRIARMPVCALLLVALLKVRQHSQVGLWLLLELVLSADSAARLGRVKCVDLPCLVMFSSLAATQHGVTFVSAFEKGCVVATQFHPELSGTLGLGIMKVIHCRAKQASLTHLSAGLLRASSTFQLQRPRRSCPACAAVSFRSGARMQIMTNWRSVWTCVTGAWSRVCSSRAFATPAIPSSR